MKLFPLVFFVGLIFSTMAHALEVDFENDKSLPIVYVNVAIKAGSVTDPKDQGGLSNFMGEMLLRGTKSKTKEQIDLALDQMGARLGVEIRAEAMIFRGAVLSSQLEPYLGLLTEILTQPSFPDEEIKKLRAEIISGLQEELGHDGSLASRRFTEYLLLDHPYGRPTIGKVKSLESLTKDKIAAQYDRIVRDRLLLVVGSGDASSDRITSWAKDLAALRPNGTLTANDEQLLEKVSAPQNSNHRRLLLIDKPDRTQTQINFGQIGIRMTDDDYFPLYLGNYAFGGSSFSAILMTEIRVKRGWSYGANSGFRYGLQPRSWVGHLFPASKDATNALATSLQLVESLREKGLTQDQFDFAKKSLGNSAGFMYNTPPKRVENKLLEKTLNLPEGILKTYGKRIEKLKLDEVNAALKKFLRPDQLAISVLCTAKDLKEGLAKAAGVPLEQVSVVSYTQE